METARKNNQVKFGARPGQHPYEGVRADDLDLLKFDLKVIKEGGYNTIRTWSEFSEAQLKLVQESGLKGFMGLEVNPEKDYGDPEFVQASVERVKRVTAYAKKSPRTGVHPARMIIGDSM